MKAAYLEADGKFPVLVFKGIHLSHASTYISGTGTAGVDNTAQTVLGTTLPADTLSQVGDRIRIRVY